MIQIRPAQISDLKKYHEHFNRQEAESGKSLETIFSPYEAPVEIPFSVFEESAQSRWQRPLSEPGWRRVWILSDSDDVRGHIILRHDPELRTCLHRTTLQMGIERSHCAKGNGSKLMQTAIQWAREQPSIDWLELFVFEHNIAARKLYQKFGFKEVGTTPDFFRVHGHKISDVKMILQLRE
jgi:RimJ/RimL family protein N-acetyltransferase